MSNIRPEFEFLNRLREGGTTNMYSASPILAFAFDHPKHEASKILLEWMSWVSENPSNRDR
jgi:hypothetical protein